MESLAQLSSLVGRGGLGKRGQRLGPATRFRNSKGSLQLVAIWHGGGEEPPQHEGGEYVGLPAGADAGCDGESVVEIAAKCPAHSWMSARGQKRHMRMHLADAMHGRAW